MELAVYSLTWFGRPLIGALCACLAWRRGYQGFGPFLSGLLMGPGVLPVVLWLTREPRPRAWKGADPGLSTAGDPTAESDLAWEDWCHFYLGMRLRLVLNALIVLAVPAVLAASVWVLPAVVTYFAYAEPTGSRLLPVLAIELLWPSLVATALVGGYATPWFGPVWLHSDRIWSLFALGWPARPLPEEVRRRGSFEAGEVDLNQEREALARSSCRASEGLETVLPAFFGLVVTALLLLGTVALL